jgi:hypothetical protein
MDQSDQLNVRDREELRETVARKCLEAVMAALITIAIVVAVAGIALGAYLKICFAIRRDDRTKWGLRRDAPDKSTQSARALVGINNSRWD